MRVKFLFTAALLMVLFNVGCIKQPVKQPEQSLQVMFEPIISKTEISVISEGIGDDSLKGTEKYRQSAELAAILNALRGIVENAVNIEEKIQRLSEGSKFTDEEKKEYEMLKEYKRVSEVMQFLLGTTPNRTFDSNVSITGFTYRRGRGPIQMTSNTLLKDYELIEDVIRVVVGTKRILFDLDNTAVTVKGVEYAPALFEALRKEGFRWTIEYNDKERTAICKLTYPLSEIKNRLEIIQAKKFDGLITESEGYACMGKDRTKKQTETAAMADAKRKSVEQVSTYIKSETHVKDFALEKDLAAAYANATVEVIQEIEKGWYKDSALGDCYKVKIKAEVIPNI